MQRQMDGLDGRHDSEAPTYSARAVPNLGSGLGSGLGADLDAERGLHSGLHRDAESDTRPESESLPALGYLPWLETVAPRKRREQEPAEGRERSELETLGASHFGQFDPADSLAALIHDTRNMVSAIDLYCDLLEEPGVLSVPFRHYAGELRMVGGASRRLLEKLSVLDLARDFEAGLAASKSEVSFGGRVRGLAKKLQTPNLALNQVADSAQLPTPELVSDGPGLARTGRVRFFEPGERIQNLADELLANQNILSAVVGPGITVGLSLHGGHCRIGMSGDDLTRILVNLCRNAAEAMPGGGHIQVALEEGPETLLLTVTDNGPGISVAMLETIFSPGFSGHVGIDREGRQGPGSTERIHAWPAQHRGLGLAIVRSIVSAAGGSVWAANRSGGSAPGADLGCNQRTGRTGAVFSIEFPLVQSSIESSPEPSPEYSPGRSPDQAVP